MQYVTEELRTYHDQITGVTNRITMVLRLRNVKFFMSPIVVIANRCHVALLYVCST